MGRQFKGLSLSNDYGLYKIEGVVDNDMFVTGTWESRIERDKHSGAFQLVSNMYGNNMKGQWIGFNREGIIQVGPIEWRFFKQKLKRKQKKMLFKDIRTKKIDTYLQEQNLLFIPDPLDGE